ncbi:MAG: hypothetical protein HC773_28025, partial [Scytonema sp. CRU_2_7]|nr:hypothetical protein [Scytonema sp. CRU_2_7]
ETWLFSRVWFWGCDRSLGMVERCDRAASKAFRTGGSQVFQFKGYGHTFA